MNLPRPMKAVDISDSWNNGYAAASDYDPMFVVEPKVDGVRAYLLAEGGRTRLFVATSEREIEHALPQMDGLEDRFSSILLDGELVIPGESLGKIVGALNATKRRAILDRAVFYAFDVFHFEAQNTRGRFITKSEPLGYRREVLEGVAEFFPDGVRIINQYPIAEPVLDAIKMAGFEGFMLKRTDAPYVEGKRSPLWRKVKWTSTIDCFVSGWEPGRGGYEGLVGSLKMSVWDGDEAIEIGKHGVFSEQVRVDMTAEDGSLSPNYLGRVMEVTYQSIGTDMRLRHPRFLRNRPDKHHTECMIDQLKEENRPLSRCQGCGAVDPPNQTSGGHVIHTGYDYASQELCGPVIEGWER